MERDRAAFCAATAPEGVSSWICGLRYSLAGFVCLPSGVGKYLVVPPACSCRATETCVLLQEQPTCCLCEGSLLFGDHWPLPLHFMLGGRRSGAVSFQDLFEVHLS